MTAANFVSNVTRRRKEKGWSQEELAKEARIGGQATISRLEAGERVSAETLQKVADALGTTPEELVPADQLANGHGSIWAICSNPFCPGADVFFVKDTLYFRWGFRIRLSEELVGRTKFCPRCGKDLESGCSACGTARLYPDQRYCMGCRALLITGPTEIDRFRLHSQERLHVYPYGLSVEEQAHLECRIREADLTIQIHSELPFGDPSTLKPEELGS